MKYKIIFTIAIFLTLKTYAQQKYILRSIPTYDSLGNVWGTQREFDYPPTKEDSIQFQIDSRRIINNMIDSAYKPKQYPQQKRKAIKKYKL